MPVVVKGLVETRRALAKFEPDLKREVDREARGFLKVMITDARGFVPSSMPQNLHNWGNRTLGPLTKAQSESRPFPKYEAGDVKVGLKYKVGGMKNNNSGFRAIYALRNESPAGAIYETAGRITPDGLPHAGPLASRTDRKVSHSRNPGAGELFINELDKNDGQRQIKGKKEGRLAFRALERNNGRAIKGITAAITDASNRFIARQGARKAFA